LTGIERGSWGGFKFGLRITLLFLGWILVVGAESESTHAERQFAALQEDRPALAEALDPRESLKVWILERFQNNAPPLFWSPAPPISGRLAEFDARDSVQVFVRVDKKPSGIDQLANLIFELNNALGYEAFDSIHERAVNGEIGREEYAELMLGQDMVTLSRAREIYRSYVEELSDRERGEAKGYYLLLYGPDTVAERVEMYLERGFDLRDHFRELYDEYVIPEMKP